VVVFDGDDTLWRTQEVYDAIKSRFATLLVNQRLEAPDSIAILDRIDSEAAVARGFTVERFVDSMLHTYRAIASQRKRKPSARIENDIRALAGPLLGDYQLYPDTIEVLEVLSRQFELVLATKGQRDLQERKVERLHLGIFFSQMYFLAQKTEADYREILLSRRVPATRAWAVGNSVRSDINPAVRAGMHAIWIRRPTWIYEEAALDTFGVVTVSSLRQAADVLLAQEHGQKGFARAER
jgi:putative hydrolase of the HAD superfamily